MMPLLLPRHFPRVIPLLLLLALAPPRRAACQSPDPVFAEPVHAAQVRLAQAAREAQPPPGRCEAMERQDPAERAAETDSVDGRWLEMSLGGLGVAAIYDPVRDRMVVFGGYDHVDSRSSLWRNDTWTLSLTGTPEWTKLTLVGTPPSPSGGPGIYDPVRDQMVVLGGHPPATDVWTLSLGGTPEWTHFTPTGALPARGARSAIYDPVRDRMVVFWANNISSTRTIVDVWALSLAGTPEWTQLAPKDTLPNEWSSRCAIYDPLRDRLLIIGGHPDDIIPPTIDVWALPLAGTPAWTHLTPVGFKPRARFGHSVIYDPVRDRIVVFAGSYFTYAEDIACLNDVWTLPLTGTLAWTQLTPGGSLPRVRYGQSTIYDPVRDRLVTFGGIADEDSPYFDDAWELTLGGAPAWAELESGSPRSLSGPAIYDPPRDRWVQTGASRVGGQTPTYDVWAASLGEPPAWTRLTPAGLAPAARLGESAVYDPVRDRMVVYGGYPYEALQGPNFSDVWALSLAGTPTWTLLTPAGTPPGARARQSAIYDPVRDRMVVFGGSPQLSSGQYFDDVWALSLTGTPQWTQLTPTGTPPNGVGQAGIYDPVRDRMVVFAWHINPSTAGYEGGVWALSLTDTPVWSQLTPAEDALMGGEGSAIYDPVRDRLVVFGGAPNNWGEDYYLDDVWALPLSGAPVWTQLTPAGTTPPARSGHRAIYDPVKDRMVMIGGGKQTYYLGHHQITYNDMWSLLWGTPVRDVAIDVRPGDSVNVVNLGAHGVLPVAILSDATFDATTVDPLSVKLAGAGVRLRPNGSPLAFRQDANEDGRADLVLHIETDGLELAPADTVARLSGSAPNHLIIRGRDRVRVAHVPPPKPGAAPLAAGASSAPALLAVRGVAGCGVRVSLTILPGEPASLELLDVAGRRVRGLALEGSGSGPREENLEGGTPTPGVYWVRLKQADHVLVRRVVLLR